MLPQIIFPGLVVLLDHPFEVMAVPALALTFIVTIIGVHRTPAAWLGVSCSESTKNLEVATKVFTKVSILFVVYTVRPLPLPPPLPSLSDSPGGVSAVLELRSGGRQEKRTSSLTIWNRTWCHCGPRGFPHLWFIFFVFSWHV